MSKKPARPQPLFDLVNEKESEAPMGDSMIDRMRKRQSTAPSTVDSGEPGMAIPLPPLSPVATTASAKPKKEKPQSAATKPLKAHLKHSCGCTQSVANLENQACPKCQQKNRVERNRKRAEKRAVLEPGNPLASADGRLPDLSEFSVVYDAEKQQWNGKLLVTNPQPKVFEGTASGVFKLLKLLDRQFRLWATEQAAKTPG